MSEFDWGRHLPANIALIQRAEIAWLKASGPTLHTRPRKGRSWVIYGRPNFDKLSRVIVEDGRTYVVLVTHLNEPVALYHLQNDGKLRRKDHLIEKVWRDD